MAAFHNAVMYGVSPGEFWGLTPYLTRQAVCALADGRSTSAWLMANLSRAKKMPKLESLLVRREVDHADMEARMKNALKNMGKRQWQNP